MGFVDWLFNRKRERIVYPLDPSLIKNEKIVNELQKKVMTLESQLSEYKAIERQNRDANAQKNEDKENIEYLKKQETDIKDKKFGKAIGLKNFYKEFLLNRKFRDSLEITDKDDTEVLGKFGDFVILSNGNMGVTDTHGNILSYGKNLRSVIYKPESLLNQLRRKRILIPCDRNGTFYPDVEQVEVPELSYLDGQFKWAKMRSRPFKEALIEKQKMINELSEHINLTEQENVDLKRDLEDKNRAIKVYMNQSDNSKTELSKSMDKSIQFEQKIGDMQMKIVDLMQLKTMNEKIISSIENINAELLVKVEELGVKPQMLKVQDAVKDLIEWAKTNVPKSITQVMPEQKEEKPAIQPGQRV
jgi:hypothetical protein